MFACELSAISFEFQKLYSIFALEEFPKLKGRSSAFLQLVNGDDGVPPKGT